MLTLQVRRVLSPRATWKKNLVHRTQQTIKLLNIMKTLRKPSYHRTPLPASLSLSTLPPLFSESLWVSPAHPHAPPLPLHHTSFSLSISCSKTSCMPSFTPACPARLCCGQVAGALPRPMARLQSCTKMNSSLLN